MIARIAFLISLFAPLLIGAATVAFATSTSSNQTQDKNFQTCYTTVMNAEAQSSPAMAAVAKAVPADKVLPSFKVEVIQNMTQPTHLKPDFPGENMTSIEGTMNQIAQCMIRLQK
jgi:hypothetical protein